MRIWNNGKHKRLNSDKKNNNIIFVHKNTSTFDIAIITLQSAGHWRNKLSAQLAGLVRIGVKVAGGSVVG